MYDLTARSKLFAIWDENDDAPDDILADVVGCSPVTVDTYRQDYSRRGKNELVKIGFGDIPLITRKGGVWCVPVNGRTVSCKPLEGREGCPYFERCREAVRLGHYIACEKVLVKEMFDEEEYTMEEVERFVYKPTEEGRSASVHYCRYAVPATPSRSRQCFRKPTVWIGEYGFCLQHAKRVKRELLGGPPF